MIAERDGEVATSRRLPSKVWKESKARVEEWDRVKMRSVGKLGGSLLVGRRFVRVGSTHASRATNI